MKKKVYLIGAIAFASAIKAQQLQHEYTSFIRKADSLYEAKDYKNSAYAYSAAFKANGWKGTPNDRYSAACSWAMANVPDSAFFNLERIISRGFYTNYNYIIKDSDLLSLHNDARWTPLTEAVKKNKDKTEENFNKTLVHLLDSIYNEDQNYRLQLIDVEQKYGRNSKAIDSLWHIIMAKDASNLISVTKILDQYGWLGADVIGNEGNETLFLVIQHSDQKTQEKYLPMMREAVKNGKANGGSLALLEDRVGLGQGKKQVYGSQISIDPATGVYYVLPLEDPDNVDKRRAQVGLQPLSEYVKHWNITWDVNQYKKDLPALEKKLNDYQKKK